MGPRWTRPSLVLLGFALLAAGVVAPGLAHAATFTVINNDGPGEGFNDPSPRTPVGGNTGTTLGQQRLIAFQYAASIWGGLLSSAVTIQVTATFDPLTCGPTSAVLGSAGATNAFRDFSGAPLASTWYPVALANALHGSDLSGSADINAQFNSAIGTTCSFPRSWYYGLDGNAGGDIDFVTVLLHELGHGLGFTTLVNLATGAKAMGLNDTYMLNLENHGASPADYPSMTNAQRVAASISTGNLHWVGANIRAASGLLNAGRVGDHVSMFAPNPQQPGSSVAHWDTALLPDQVMEPVYTVPLDPELELPLFQDIGWTLLPLSVSLTPNPASGTAPLNPTLTATVSGGTGTMNYTFWWNCADASTSVSTVTAVCGDPSNPSVGAKFTGVAATSQGTTHSYAAAGTFTAKVIAERGFSPAGESRATITVSSPPPPPQTLTVASSNPNSGVTMTVSPTDNNGQGNGVTSFSRVYNVNTVVTLTAPGTAPGGNVFQKWQRDAVDYAFTAGTQVTMDAAHTLTAIYAPHTLGITNGPSGSPNPVASGATATATVTAVDSLGHGLSYGWTASCPTLPSNGSFDNANAQSPLWTAPTNATGSQKSCTLEVTVSDGQGLSQIASYSQGVSSIALTPPTIGKSFGAAQIALNGATSLSFTVGNPNVVATLTGVGVSDPLPSGLVVATPNGLTGNCGGGTITAPAGAATVSLSNAALAAGASCGFAVNVTGTTLGVKNNTTGNVTSIEAGSGGTASAGLEVMSGIVDCAPITTLPAVITVQGRYCFTGNLATAITSGHAIDVQASNVLLDLNGYRLDGLAAGSGTTANGIHALNRQNVTIRNGTVRGFLRGIFLENTGSQGHVIEDVRADQNTFVGIAADGSGNMVRNNQVAKTGGTTAVVPANASGFEIQGDGARVLNNDVIDTVAQAGGTARGIHLIGTGHMVVDNRITVADRGIEFDGATGKFSGNLTTLVTTPYIGGTDTGNNF